MLSAETFVSALRLRGGLETVATAYCCDFQVQGCIFRQTASLYQRLRSLFAAEDLGQHLPVGLIVLAEVAADTALTVSNCDHVDFLRVRCDAHIVRIGCTTDPVLIAIGPCP